MKVSEAFKVHLTEEDVLSLEDSFIEPLLEACGWDEEGVFVWCEVDV